MGDAWSNSANGVAVFYRKGPHFQIILMCCKWNCYSENSIRLDISLKNSIPLSKFSSSPTPWEKVQGSCKTHTWLRKRNEVIQKPKQTISVKIKLITGTFRFILLFYSLSQQAVRNKQALHKNQQKLSAIKELIVELYYI